MLRLGNYKSLLLIGVILSASLALTFAPEVNAHDGGGFDFTGEKVANYQDWMAGLPNNAWITELSIPGTHDSMAIQGGNIARTQVMSLEEQLDSGIRHIDIRVKYEYWEFVGLNFPILLPCFDAAFANDVCGFHTYHNIAWQATNLEDDILPVIRDFLNAHEGETIIMNIHQEGPGDRNKLFTEGMNDLLDDWENDIDIFDRTCSTPNNLPNADLDDGIAQLGTGNGNCDARGKLLIFASHWTHPDATDPDWLKHTMGAWDSQYPRERPITFTYDEKADLIDRWGDMEEALDDAATDPDFATLWYIDLAGSGYFGGGLVEPFFVANGHDTPDKFDNHIWTGVERNPYTLPNDKYKDFPRYLCAAECKVFYEGMNELVQLCLRGEKLHEGNFGLDPRRVCDNTSQFKGRLGIVSADFPGARLIQGVINSNDFNQPPTISAPASVDVDENTTAVADVNSSDPDGDTEGSGLTYSLSGTDSAKFSIDAAGNLAFVTAPDFENPTDDGTNNVYDVTVTVTDSGGATDSQAIAVTVDDVNEKPTISAPSSVDVDENTTAVTDVNSSDPEDSEGSGLTYSLSGTDSAKFSIDAAGNLAFVTAPDFETPTDGDTDNDYEVTVTVTDSGGLTDSQAITVTVEDVNEKPTAEAGGPYSGDEGSAIAIDATGSTDPDEGDEENLTYLWSTDGGGIISDTSAATTNVTYPDNGSFTLTLKVTDPDGLEDTDTATVTVSNVKPTVSPDVIGSEDENTAIKISGSVSDPGWKDTFVSATVDWGDETSLENVSTSGFEQMQPDATMNYEATHTYGDNGVFTAEVCVTDDDGGKGCKSVNLTINNVDPTAEIDETNTLSIQGTPTFIGQINTPMDFVGNSIDPGSDDITFTWDWDDGSNNSLKHLLDPPNNDPSPSPSINPRNEDDTKTKTWTDACLYVVNLDTKDDDAGTGNDSTSVVIVGGSESNYGAGYWQSTVEKLLSGKGKPKVDQETMQCYLDITSHMSAVYYEKIPLATISEASNPFNDDDGAMSLFEQLDRQILATWVNFANGGVGLDDLVDTDGDKIGDTVFSVAISTAESVRLNPASSILDLETQKEKIQYINLMDES